MKPIEPQLFSNNALYLFSCAIGLTGLQTHGFVPVFPLFLYNWLPLHTVGLFDEASWFIVYVAPGKSTGLRPYWSPEMLAKTSP